MRHAWCWLSSAHNRTPWCANSLGKVCTQAHTWSPNPFSSEIEPDEHTRRCTSVRVFFFGSQRDSWGTADVRATFAPSCRFEPCGRTRRRAISNRPRDRNRVAASKTHVLTVYRFALSSLAGMLTSEWMVLLRLRRNDRLCLFVRRLSLSLSVCVAREDVSFPDGGQRRCDDLDPARDGDVGSVLLQSASGGGEG